MRTKILFLWACMFRSMSQLYGCWTLRTTWCMVVVIYFMVKLNSLLSSIPTLFIILFSSCLSLIFTYWIFINKPEQYDTPKGDFLHPRRNRQSRTATPECVSESHVIITLCIHCGTFYVRNYNTKYTCSFFGILYPLGLERPVIAIWGASC